MTQNPEYPAGTAGGTPDTARHEAERLGSDAQDAAHDVAGTAKEEATHVKDEAVGQAQSLAESAKQEATSQLSTQQNRLAQQSRTVSDDLERISRGEKPESDLVNQAVTMLSQKARQLTEQLESKEPLDLLDDVRHFAARRPGTFLAIAAGIGLVAGRLTRGLKDSHSDDRQGDRAGRPALPGGPALPDPRAAGYTGQIPRPPAEPPTVAEPDPVTGTPATEVLGTPAVTDPYGTGRPHPGGRP